MSFRSSLRDVRHNRTRFDFTGRGRRWLLLSGTVILISVLSLGLRALNLGIEFTGGTSWQFTMAAGKGNAKTADIRSVAEAAGVKNPKVLVLGSNGARVQAENMPAAQVEAVAAALATYAGIQPNEVSVTDVGPTWGKQVSAQALRALIVFILLVALYLVFRFEWRMAIAAIIAMIHDVVITVGVYSLTGFEVTPGTVIAFLTILGFSLYDTVVVFDRIKENEAAIGQEKGDTYSAMVNRSMNQVLLRSLGTTFTAVLPVASLLVVGVWLLGAVALRDFALALFVGLIAGAYSSIFVAGPLVAYFKEREPKFRAMRARSETWAIANARTAAATSGRAASRGGAGIGTGGTATATAVLDDPGDGSVRRPDDAGDGPATAVPPGPPLPDPTPPRSSPPPPTSAEVAARARRQRGRKRR